MFISIKRLLEGKNAAAGQSDLLEAFRQMASLLLDGMAKHVVHGREGDLNVFRRKFKTLARQIDEPQSAIGLLGIASDAVETLEMYSQRTDAHVSEGNRQMSSMIAVLAQTVVDLSDHTDDSVARLQAIEKQVELASGLEDWRALRANLENCLLALREAAARQRSNSASVVQRVQQEIGKVQQRNDADRKQRDLAEFDLDLVPESFEDPKAVLASYVAAFRLQRAEYIAKRYGENTVNQMLSVIGTQLKTALGPGDRLLRWKGTSFVIFLKTAEAPIDVRRRLSEAVAVTRQQYIDVGNKSALLSVGADWMMFPEWQCPSLEAVFAEVETFLANSGSKFHSAVEERTMMRLNPVHGRGSI